MELPACFRTPAERLDLSSPAPSSGPQDCRRALSHIRPQAVILDEPDRRVSLLAVSPRHASTTAPGLVALPEAPASLHLRSRTGPLPSRRRARPPASPSSSWCLGPDADVRSCCLERPRHARPRSASRPTPRPKPQRFPRSRRRASFTGSSRSTRCRVVASRPSSTASPPGTAMLDRCLRFAWLMRLATVATVIDRDQSAADRLRKLHSQLDRRARSDRRSTSADSVA